MFNIRIAAEIVRHQLWIAIFAFIGKKLKMIAPDTKVLTILPSRVDCWVLVSSEVILLISGH